MAKTPDITKAKMNAISFYIPWDFHEYAEGKFDFHGTVDQDNDGNCQKQVPKQEFVTEHQISSDRMDHGRPCVTSC